MPEIGPEEVLHGNVGGVVPQKGKAAVKLCARLNADPMFLERASDRSLLFEGIAELLLLLFGQTDVQLRIAVRALGCLEDALGASVVTRGAEE